LVPILPNHWIMGCCSNGVSFACKKWQPASSRHAFLSRYLEENSCCSPLAAGPMTACSMPFLVFVHSTNQTSLAVFLAFSVCQCCFHIDFVDIPLACAWAWIRLAIHISRRSGSAFRRLKLLYASQICSWMIERSRWKLLGWLVIPPFLLSALVPSFQLRFLSIGFGGPSSTVFG